jgi:hypothetical protein
VNSGFPERKVAPAIASRRLFFSAGRNCVRRLVKALSRSVHRRREHAADLGFSGEELVAE